MMTNKQSPLTWRLRRLITDPKPQKTKLDRGLYLSWYPADEYGVCELRTGRRNSQPSEKEDRIILNQIKLAARAEGFVADPVVMRPGETAEGKYTYGVTVFRFRLAKQPGLFEKEK